MDIILAHRQIDFDALASMVAAQKLYPGSVFVMDSKANPFVQDFLALAKDRLPFRSPQDISLRDISRVILVDTHDLRRAGGLGERVAEIADLQVEVYDHHPYTGTLHQGWYIEPVGACTTLFVERLAGLGLPLSSFEATLLALGIYDDTGSLLFENTTVRDVRAVAYLLEQGAHLGVIGEYLRRPLTEEQKALLQQLLDSGQTEMFDGSPVYLASAESDDYIGGLALLAHRVGELEGAETWFLVVQMENRVYVVGRSRGKGLPVNQIVQVFGGSGHTKAASASLKGTDYRTVLEKLRREIRSKAQKPYLAKDMMSFPVKTVSPDTKLSDVEQILLRYGHTGLPVVNGQKLVGIISRRDVDKALKHGLAHAPVKAFMTTNVVTVDAKAGWDEVQRLMVQYDIGRLPVVEDDKVVGIVSRSDVLRIVHGSAVPIEAALARERSQAMRQDILDLMERLPAGIRILLETARDVAGAEGCSVYLVGGFVRDLLLLVPSQDLDFVVEGSGHRFAEALAARFPQGQLTRHDQFGTARISFPDGTHVDVASTRWEYYAFPGALPQVEESCLRDDLFRRDFTINAMAICLKSERYGELVDYYGGLRDLQQGEIRLLHNLSFIDDPTRMLRAVRFAGRYNFTLAKETSEGLRTALKAEVLRQLSAERFTEELMLIFKEQGYQKMGRSLQESGVLTAWFQAEYPWNFNEFKPAELEDEKKSDVWHWLVSLVHMSDDEIKEAVSKLRLPRSLHAVILEYVRLRTELRNGSFNLGQIDNFLHDKEDWFINVLLKEKDLTRVITEYLQARKKINMKVDGKKLRELGVKQGPRMGRILAEIRRAWLEGRIHSADEEVKYVRQLLEALY